MRLADVYSRHAINDRHISQRLPRSAFRSAQCAGRNIRWPHRGKSYARAWDRRNVPNFSALRATDREPSWPRHNPMVGVRNVGYQQSRCSNCFGFAAAGCSQRPMRPAHGKRVVLVERCTLRAAALAPGRSFVLDSTVSGLAHASNPAHVPRDYWMPWRKDPFANQTHEPQQWYSDRNAALTRGQSGCMGSYPQMIRASSTCPSAKAGPFARWNAPRVDRSLDLAAKRRARLDARFKVQLQRVARSGPSRLASGRGACGHAGRTARGRGENAVRRGRSAVVRALSDRIPLSRGPQGSIAVRLTKPKAAWSDIDGVGFAQARAREM